MKFFTDTGHLKIGKTYSGTHATKLPSGYCQWASDAMKGFQEELEQALLIPIPEPKATNPNARQYKLSPRHFDDTIPNPTLNSRLDLLVKAKPIFGYEEEDDEIPMHWEPTDDKPPWND